MLNGVLFAGRMAGKLTRDKAETNQPSLTRKLGKGLASQKAKGCENETHTKNGPNAAVFWQDLQGVRGGGVEFSFAVGHVNRRSSERCTYRTVDINLSVKM